MLLLTRLCVQRHRSTCWICGLTSCRTLPVESSISCRAPWDPAASTATTSRALRQVRQHSAVPLAASTTCTPAPLLLHLPCFRRCCFSGDDERWQHRHQRTAAGGRARVARQRRGMLVHAVERRRHERGDGVATGRRVLGCTCGRVASRRGVSSLWWHVLVCVRSPHDLLKNKLCRVMFHSPLLTVAAFHRAGSDQHRGAVQLDHGRRIRVVCPRLRRVEGTHQAAV